MKTMKIIKIQFEDSTLFSWSVFENGRLNFLNLGMDLKMIQEDEFMMLLHNFVVIRFRGWKKKMAVKEGEEENSDCWRKVIEMVKMMIEEKKEERLGDKFVTFLLLPFFLFRFLFLSFFCYPFFPQMFSLFPLYHFLLSIPFILLEMWIGFLSLSACLYWVWFICGNRCMELLWFIVKQLVWCWWVGLDWLVKAFYFVIQFESCPNFFL